MDWLALVPTLLLATTPPPRGDATVSVDFKEADVVDVVRLMSEIGSFQTVVDPGVSCRLTLKLREVAWPIALDMALRVCGLGHEEEGGIVRVAPVAKLTAEQLERRRLEEESRLARPLQTRVVRLTHARAADLAPLLRKYLSPRGDVSYDVRTNTLFITDVN